MQQQPLPFLHTLPDTEPSESLWERLYRYFADAEETQGIVTSVKIQQIWLTATGELRDLDAIRWYMYRYWRWFLFLEDDGVKPYRYRCKHIKAYPLDYFVQAHIDTDRMQYLVHFVRSIEKDKELRKQAMGRGRPRKPRPAFPVQPSLDVDDQQQEEIQVDGHEEEEGNIPDIDFFSEEQETASSFVIDAVEGASLYTEPASPDTEDTNAQNEVKLPLPDPPPFETPDPPQSDSLPLWSRVKSAIIDHKKEVSWAVGIGLIVCAIAVYFFVRH